MKKKQTLAVLLAAAMVLSMPVGTYAEELDVEENASSLVESYVVVITAPTISKISAERTELKAGERTNIVIEADDDISGLDLFSATFRREGTKDYISTDFNTGENPYAAELRLSPYLPSGTYVLSSINISDKAGNRKSYDEEPIEGYSEKLPNQLTLEIKNENKEDVTAPTISKISAERTELKAGEKTNIVIEADDDISGLDLFSATFRREGTKDYILTDFNTGENPYAAELRLSPYLPSGTYVLSSINISDKAGNRKSYDEEPIEGYSEKLPNQLTLEIKNENKEDVTAPTISKISAERTELKAGEKTNIVIEADDDISGLDLFSATFRREGTKDYISTDFNTGENPYAAELRLSPYLPSGTYVLSSINISDKAGNRKSYDEEPIEGYSEALPNALSLTIINDDPVTPPPTDPETPSNPSNPTTPSRPNSSTTTAPGTPINYESEKPDPADEQAVEAYNFWQNTKREIRVYERAGSLRVYVPADVTYMPASVMETLRVENVPVVLQWQGHRIEIPAGKAQPKQPLKAYWPMKTLCELYNA